MTGAELFDTAGSARSAGFLRETLGTPEGRKTMLYILSKMGFFSRVEGAEAEAVRNAAVMLLDDITAQTGFVLNIDLIR